MMRLILGLLVLSPLSSFGEDLLQKHCNEMGGTVVNSFQCPKSKLTLKWNFCLLQNHKGEELFFDGCTGPSGGHTELFYTACIKHDFCYHHEPLTSGLGRKACDEEFLKNTLDACPAAPEPEKCRQWARAMYKALRGFGEVAFNCSKSKAEYKDL